MRIPITPSQIVFAVCVSSFSVTQVASADNPAMEADSIRAEISQLQESIARLNSRVDALEERLKTLESQQESEFRWMNEQPFYWDSMAPVPGELERRLRDTQRGRRPSPIR